MFTVVVSFCLKCAAEVTCSSQPRSRSNINEGGLHPKNNWTAMMQWGCKNSSESKVTKTNQSLGDLERLNKVIQGQFVLFLTVYWAENQRIYRAEHPVKTQKHICDPSHEGSLTATIVCTEGEYWRVCLCLWMKKRTTQIKEREEKQKHNQRKKPDHVSVLLRLSVWAF